MKTLDEVIESITKYSGIEMVDIRKPKTDRFWVDRETYMDALQYLRWYKELADDSEAFAEWKENPPLTWDELKQMEGKPVWVEYDIRHKDRTLRTWCLVLIVLDENMSITTNAVAFSVKKSELGTRWQAYRKERG